MSAIPERELEIHFVWAEKSGTISTRELSWGGTRIVAQTPETEHQKGTI
jgi:hypothetical protein